jgi:hypothetical protein
LEDWIFHSIALCPAKGIAAAGKNFTDSLFLSFSLSLCDMNVNWRIGFFVQLLYVQQKELLHGFFIQLLYVNSSCAVFLYASAQSAMWENMSDCIGAHFRSMKIQSAIFNFFSDAFAWGPCILTDAIQTFSYSGTTVRNQCFLT